MLVYGDHSEFTDPRERLQEVSAQLARAATMRSGIARHAMLVAALISAGQLMQGVADADFADVGCDRATATIRALTAFASAIAKAVCRSWDSGFEDIGVLDGAVHIAGLPARVELRTPEGFAFYAVYPEAYIEAARRLALCAPPRVIGIRSIGTTLAAAVAAAISAPLPITLRPYGDPFARRLAIAAELERELIAGEAHYVIVDEGPGQSGSSFGAVVDWLQDRGVPLERIALLPSHPGLPGPQAGEAQCERWRRMQRIAADFSERLADLLHGWLAKTLGSLDEPLTDISAGAWRALLFASEADWPAVATPWERRKFLARASGNTFLVKFAGLGTVGERKLRMARALHSAGFTPEPIGLVHGFLVERWCENAKPIGSNEKPIEDVARYIGARTRLFPAEANQGASLDALLDMCRRNASLSFGEGTASRFDRWSNSLEHMSRRVVRVRTDNRLDRHEWLRVEGRLIKTDALDHHAAHDLIGCQDLAWDVAGALTEFALDGVEADQLIAAAEQASGRHVDRELLEFYTAAYLAFRLGQASLAAEMPVQDRAERSRLTAAAAHYATRLQHLLDLLEGTRGATRQESLVG